MTIQEFLRNAMRERGWNVPRLAEECDVSLGLAAKWVSDNPRYRVNPSPRSCRKIARALDLDADDVLALAGHREAGAAQSPNPADSVDPELRRRLGRMEQRLKPYPRAFWLAVLDANERMIDAADAVAPNPPPQEPANPPSQEPIPPLRRRSRDPKTPLTGLEERELVAA